MSHPTATAPLPDDPLVLSFLGKYQLAGPAVSVSFEDHGYDPSQCHLSAKHAAITKGGRRVHGWALWQFGAQIDAEHHSIWQNPDDDLVDVTPPKFGGDRVLFVRDDVSDIICIDDVFLMWTDRTTVPDTLFVYNSKAHAEPCWGLMKSNPVVVDYCARLGIWPDDMLTDPQRG
jgi:hypothetical protein